MMYQLVIWCRYGVDIDYSHIYTTLFSSNYKILFEIWITVKSNMISQFMVAMAPIQNIQTGGALECQGGYQARPKIHVIRVVFSGSGTVRAYIV